MTVPDLSARLLPGGLSVQPLGIGCRSIGGPTTGASRDAAQDANALDGLLLALKHDVNVFDTAATYGQGHADRLLGQMLETVPRENVVISTTVGSFRGTAPHPYAAPHLRHQVEQVLANLNTTHVDVVCCEGRDFGPANRYLEEAVGTLRALQDEGFIRLIGLSLPLAGEDDAAGPGATGNRLDVDPVLDAVSPDVLRVRYSPLSPEPRTGDDGVFSYAARHNIVTLIGEPLAGGLLTGGYRPDGPHSCEPPSQCQPSWFTHEGLTVLQQGLQPLRERFGDTPQALTRVALRYCLAQSDQAVVLPGFSSRAQVELNLTCLGAPLTGEEFAFAQEVYRRLRVALAGIGGAPGDAMN